MNTLLRYECKEIWQCDAGIGTGPVFSAIDLNLLFYLSHITTL
jgi:hypothetical protein